MATAKYHHYELASAAFQIGIVLASATIITGMIALAWVSGLLALAGIGITALGLFAPHLLHLHVEDALIAAAQHLRSGDPVCRGAVVHNATLRTGSLAEPTAMSGANSAALRARSCGSAGSAAACARTSLRRRRAEQLADALLDRLDQRRRLGAQLEHEFVELLEPVHLQQLVRVTSKMKAVTPTPRNFANTMVRTALSPVFVRQAATGRPA